MGEAVAMRRGSAEAEDDPWKNTPARLREEGLQKSGRGFKATTGVGLVGFHPKVPPDLTKVTRKKQHVILEKVEQCGR